MLLSYFGIIYVTLSFNNIIISGCDNQGNVLCWASGGSVGYKGSKRSTAVAAVLATEYVVLKLLKNNIKYVNIYFKGLGKGREGVIRGLRKTNIIINTIADFTEIPHNGCRSSKKRRL